MVKLLNRKSTNAFFNRWQKKWPMKSIDTLGQMVYTKNGGICYIWFHSNVLFPCSAVVGRCMPT